MSTRVCSLTAHDRLCRLWITFIVFAITFVVFAVRLGTCAVACKSLLVCTSQSYAKCNDRRELVCEL